MSQIGSHQEPAMKAQPATGKSVRFDPLSNGWQMAELIGSVTGEPVERVLERLRAEFRRPGSTVADDFKSRGLEPHVWSVGLEQFYEQTDAFLYELAMWNRNRIKRKMRRTVQRLLRPDAEASAAVCYDVLTVGDGLGFDSMALAKAGHRVTYFELPGRSQRFASALFERAGVSVQVSTDPKSIPAEAFDVVICLDVLEHVPDPPGFVGTLCSYLRPNGRLIVHSPFYMVDSGHPTHLRANRRFSGSLNLFRRHDLRLIDGRPFWDPIVLARTNADAPVAPGAAGRRLLTRVVGCYLWLGRWATWPFAGVRLYQLVRQRWFDTVEPPED